MSLIGLTGSHRVGKTTLAKTYAKKHGIQFVETSVSAIFKELGYSASDRFNFTTRMNIQEVIMDRLDALYRHLPAGKQAITDRTPIDMLAYTMSEAIGDAVWVQDQVRFNDYTQRCFDMTNKYFSMIVLVQPGIALVEAEGKALSNVAYIEHLNSLILGLSVDQRLNIAQFYIQRQFVDLMDRLATLENATFQAERQTVIEAKSYQQNGGKLN